MKTQNEMRVDILDYLRGVAILAVFGVHSLGTTFGYDQLPWRGAIPDFSVSPVFLALFPLSVGGLGVAVFFVISGFCIQTSYRRGSGAGFRVFYVRRFFRLYPPYLFALLFFAIIFPSTKLHFTKPWDWAQLGSHLLLVHNLDARSFYGINPSFWAIAVEAQLYLLFPLLVALVAKLGWNRTLLCIGAIEVSMRTFFSVYTTTTELILPRWFTNSPLIYWYSWSIGAYLADAFLQARPLPFRRAPFYFWFILVLLSYFIRPLVAFRFLLASLFTVTVISKLLTESKGSDIALPRYFRPLRTIGHLSYSLYLLHQPFISLMPMLFSESSINSYMRELFIFIVCTLSIIIIAPLSWFYYRFCEIPSVSLGKWIVQKTRADRTQSVRGPR